MFEVLKQVQNSNDIIRVNLTEIILSSCLWATKAELPMDCEAFLFELSGQSIIQTDIDVLQGLLKHE